jgi:hypothetical protein
LHILLPPLQKLRTVVDRLRPMADTLTFQANNSGKLLISISTETVRVQTEWKNLTNPHCETPIPLFFFVTNYLIAPCSQRKGKKR